MQTLPHNPTPLLLLLLLLLLQLMTCLLAVG
jgi:hypothetical protein